MPTKKTEDQELFENRVRGGSERELLQLIAMLIAVKGDITKLKLSEQYASVEKTRQRAWPPRG